MLVSAASGGSRGHSGSSTPAETSPLDSLSVASAALQSLGSGFSTAGSGGHPNVFVRGLPLQWGENEMSAVFGQFGVLTSLRLVRHSVTKHSLGYGFVRYGGVGEAQAAISTLDGTSVLGHTLQVKFADADAGPPTMPVPSGLSPADTCYIKHLPASYGVLEVQQLFEAHGAVLDIKLFPCLDQFRGASALVRMASIEASDRAIAALNNSTPPGAVQSLIVRFAESAAEKAARLTRREAKGLQRMAAAGGATQPGMGADQLQQALSALSMGGCMSGLSPPPAPLVPQAYQPQVLSSICIKGMPSNADRLWIFENFSRYGAIAGLRILVDDSTGQCNGTGFVNYADGIAGERARQAMNGMRVGDKILHVMVQTHNTNNSNHNTTLTHTHSSPSVLSSSAGMSHMGASLELHAPSMVPPNMAAAAAALAAAAGQHVLPPAHAEWSSLLPPNAAMMW
ncbi:hypothetical protein D9Q98_009303 [Chlorella vulgaris]|uniref:RRM domain-containing protein n=1 Tax=Chlorella vulgaris TaxID=3077 RepID=A0A9D4TQI6_CHLVU|nr:hypothetical protein D9Q98_009303 [Chlorella vulgaris]